MKKNIDPQTAKLFEAVKTAYFRECSGIVRDNKELQPLTVDIMNQLLNGGNVNNMTIAEGVDVNKRIELMEGYSCGLASLPRIYKQVARLAGETCEKITVSPNQLEPYGFDWEIDWKEPNNKKLLAVLKKYCPAPRKNDSRQRFAMGVYHDDKNHCAVFTDAHIMIVAPWLYNPAAAGRVVASTGALVGPCDEMPEDLQRYPDWVRVIPDYQNEQKRWRLEQPAEIVNVYHVSAADVADNAATAAKISASIQKQHKTYTDESKMFVVARDENNLYFAGTEYSPVFGLVDGDLWFSLTRAYCGNMASGGLVLIMPKKEPENIDIYKNGKNIYAEPEYNTVAAGRVPVAEPGCRPVRFLHTVLTLNSDAAAPMVAPAADAEPAAEPVADVVADSADAAEVVETPAPAAAPCVALVVVPVADAEPQPEPAAAPVRDAADIEAELTAAVIRCHYSSMMAQAEPLPVVDTYDVETLSDNAAIIRCRRRGASCLIALTPRNANHYTVTSLKDGAIFTPQWSMPAARHYDDETIHPFVIWCMRDAIHDAITYFDTLPVVADAEPAAEPVPMLPDPPAVVHISGPVPPSPRRRRPAPRLRPIFRRLWRVAAVVVPLVVLAMLTASTAADNSHQTPAADAVAMTPAAALPVADDADTLQVVELPPLTVTAPRTPSGQKTGLTPSGQKTAAAVADASPTDEPTADTPAGQKTDADGLPDTLQPDSQPHGLTICEGTAWAYTMMNWA